jgi:hypothetical protein
MTLEQNSKALVEFSQRKIFQGKTHTKVWQLVQEAIIMFRKMAVKVCNRNKEIWEIILVPDREELSTLC